jgi:hypothetical protein
MDPVCNGGDGVSLTQDGRERPGGERRREKKKRTEEQLLRGRKHVHAKGHFELVDLELQPLAEALEDGHCAGLFVCAIDRLAMMVRCRLE